MKKVVQMEKENRKNQTQFSFYGKKTYSICPFIVRKNASTENTPNFWDEELEISGEKKN